MFEEHILNLLGLILKFFFDFVDVDLNVGEIKVRKKITDNLHLRADSHP